MTWSDEQNAIRNWFIAMVGHLIIRARAGTGKTTTILGAVALIPAKFQRILLCTFAKRNKIDADKKLAAMAQEGADVSRVDNRTANSLGFKYVRKFHRFAKPDDSIERDRIRQIDANLPIAVETAVLKLVGFAKNMLPFGTVEELADLAVERNVFADNGQDYEATGFTVERIAQIARRAMDLAKNAREHRLISFNDQIWLPVVNGWVTPDYDVVLGDEVQDWNPTQLILIRRACKRDGHMILVGDDKQAIYAFRGADSGSLDRYKAELNAAELPLTCTYRCGKSIVAVAQALVSDYKAAPGNHEGTVGALAVEKLQDTVVVGDAVLSRTNAPLVPLCLGLLKKGISARIEGRDIGREMADLAKRIGKSAKSVPAFLGSLNAWGDKQKARATAKAKTTEKAEAACDAINDKIEILAAIAESAKSVQAIIDTCFNLFADSFDNEGNANPKPAVVFSSVHKAKGLEWEKVFILEKTLYCGGRRQDQEEKNIHYVAVTRAKNDLVMVREAA